MSKRIPDRFDPWRFADQGKTLSGGIRLDSLPRLAPCLLERDGEVAFELRFERDAERRAVMRGSVQARLVLECQRCLQAMTQPIDSEIALAFVEGVEEAALLPESLDPCLVEEGRVSLQALIEDELLLALPQVAMHETSACQSRRSAETDSEPAQPDDGNSRNPFAILAGLKQDND